MSTNVYFDREAINKLLDGMEVVYKAVARTMGSSGKNVIYRNYHEPMVTNDGVSIARRIVPTDPVESIGADLIKQAAERTNDEAGDGTTTSTVLTYSLIKEGLEMIDKGVNPNKLRRQIEASCDEVIEEIKALSRPIKTDEELLHVANISVENVEIAKIVADAVKKAGKDGVVVVEESSGTDIVKEEIDGLRFSQGYISPYMITNPNKMEAVLNNCFVLLTDKHLQMNKDLFALLEEIKKRGFSELFIVAGDLQGELLATLIANRMKGIFHVVAVKKPQTVDFLEDIAVLTGAETFTEAKGLKEFFPAHLNGLGVAKKVVVTKDSCTIVGHPDSEKTKVKVQERIEAIKNEIKEADGYAKEKLKERLAKLVGGVVILKVGAPTEAEMKYLKLKVDDAVNATKAAMEDGIIIGGGRVLFDISLGKAKNDGDEVVRKACGVPMKQIILNSGDKFEDIVPKLESGYVYNSDTGKISKSPFEDGIIDPVKVSCCALKNACSLAAIFLTSHAVIVDIEDKKN